MKNEHMRKPPMLDASKDFLLGDGYGRGTPISIRSYLSILKGTIFASCLFVVVTWIAIGYALHGKEAGEIVEVDRQARYAARLFAEQSSRKINEIDAWLREGAYELWRNPSPARVREIITTRGWILNTQMQIRFVDSQGREIGANFDQIGSLEPPFKNSSFRGVLEQFVEPLIIDQTHLDRISSNWSTQLTRRIAFGSGEIKGELTASLDSNSFENFSKTLPKEWEFRLSLIGEDKLTQTSSVEIVNETDVKLHEFCYISGANGEEGRFPSIKMTPSFAIACMRLPDGPIFAVAAVIRGKTSADASEADAKRYYTIGSSITLMILIISLASGSSVLMRHKHELAIVIAEELLEESVECLSDGFVVYDREDRLVLFNTQFRNTFNRIAELIRPGEKFSVLNDAINKAYPDMVCNPTLRDWVNGRLNAGPRNSEDIEVEFPDGRWIRIRERVSPSGFSVGVRTDITSLKVRESELKEAQVGLLARASELSGLVKAAQESDSAKSAFVASVSHELRTPLNAIVGYSFLLRETNLNSEQLGYMDAMASATRHLSVMVNDILDLSGLETENLTVHPEAFQMSRLLVAVNSTAMGLIRNRQLDFNIETQIDIPEVLCGDRTRIKQVLFNLIANSVKFTETGQIKLSLRAKAEAGHCKVTFEVSDTGCGIAPELHDRLFNRFQQGHSSSNVRVSGTGLGLAVSRGLVRLMGGELEFESEVGKGSRFFFTLQLPIDSKTPDEKLNTEIDRFPIKKALKVLVVDDAESSRAFVSIMLEKRGHLLSEAARGENAIELSKESKFDLILMDIKMPGIGGKEAVRQIRADGGPSSNAYIVALTAQAFTSQKDEIIGSGCDAVLIKPFELEELDAILKKAMG